MEFQSKNNKQLSLAGRLFEDRWGGEMQWEKNSAAAMKCMAKVYTLNDGRLLGAYELPTVEKCFSPFSLYRP
jgi:outer membrane receptor for ferrienterochelin and colicins